jgi:hypothetical protein
MAGELYRTYEVLVEESVVREADKDPKTKKETRYNPEVAAALRDTNETFQHAVCYYTLLLAGLVKDVKDPKDPADGRLLNPLWQHLRSGPMRQATDSLVRQLAERYERLAGVTDAEGFLERVFVRPEKDGPAKERMLEQARVQTYRLLEKQGTKLDKEGLPTECETLNVFASSWGSILCDPNNETEIPGNGVYDIIHRRLLKAEGNSEAVKRALDEAIITSEETHRGDFERELAHDIAKVKSDKAKAKKVAAKEQLFRKFVEDRRSQTRSNVCKALSDGLYSKPRDLGMSKEEHDLAEKELAALADEAKTTALDDPRLRRLRYGARDNSLEKPLFRLLWLRDSPQWAPLVLQDFCNYLEKEKPLPEPELDGGHLAEAPFANLTKNLFPLFVPYMLRIPSRERSAWWNFDVSAFAAAAEDVFKYKIRTQERKRRYDRFSQARDAYQGVVPKKLNVKQSN